MIIEFSEGENISVRVQGSLVWVLGKVVSKSLDGSSIVILLSEPVRYNGLMIAGAVPVTIDRENGTLVSVGMRLDVKKDDEHA